MDFHDFLKLTGGIGALALFVPMAIEVVKDAGAGQSFATWMLWAALDTILTVSLFSATRELSPAARFCRRRHHPDDPVADQGALRLEPHGQCNFGARVRLFARLETRWRKDGHRRRHAGDLPGRNSGLGGIVAQSPAQGGKHLGLVCAGQRAGLLGRNCHDAGGTFRARSVCGLFLADVFCQPANAELSLTAGNSPG